MVTRMIDATASDFASMTTSDLEMSILKAEGRTICCECVVAKTSLVERVTNAEIVAAVGADLILLNAYDVNNPVVYGLPHALHEESKGTIKDIKRLVGRPVGINLEPTDISEEYYQGRKATIENAKKAHEQGADFIFITGNPAAGTTNNSIAKATEEIKNQMQDDLFLISGKCHGAGVLNEQGAKLLTKDDVKMLCHSGANAIAMPMPGALMGWTVDLVHELVEVVHKEGKLAWLVLDHGIEGAQKEAIIQFALNSTMAGADVFEFGDAGLSGAPWPENVMDFSFAIRGRKHTFRRMASSINR